MKSINIVLDMKDETRPVFVEVENKDGQSIKIGTYSERAKGLTNLTITADEITDNEYSKLDQEVDGLRELLASAYVELSGKTNHASDCAVSQAPAMTPGKCNCDI